jgi:hypothetical protein
VASYNNWTEVVQVVDVAAQLRSRGLPAKVCDAVLAGAEVPLVLSLMVGGVEHTPSEYQVGCWAGPGCVLGAVCCWCKVCIVPGSCLQIHEWRCGGGAWGPGGGAWGPGAGLHVCALVLFMAQGYARAHLVRPSHSMQLRRRQHASSQVHPLVHAASTD